MSGAPVADVHSAIPIVDLAPIDRALAGTDDDALRAAVKAFRPADLGHDLSRRPIEDARRLFAANDDRHGSAMLRAAHPGVAGAVLDGCDSERAARALAFMPIDHQAKILAHTAPGSLTRIEAAMAPERRAAVTQALAHPHGAVGRLMTPKIWRAAADDTAGDAMATLRELGTDIEVAANLYVVDGGRPVGVCALREVAVAAATTPLAEIMVKDPLTVREDVGAGDAADIIRTHEFLSLPVVDRKGQLVGAVRVDDLLKAAIANVGTAFLNQGAVSGDVAQTPYFQTTLARTVRSRITWLVLLFVAEMATGTVMRYFDDEMTKLVALSYFVPLLLGTGGNAGSQTVSTVIRALALGEVRTRDVWRVVGREILTGLCVGLIIGVIAFGRALLWGVDVDLAVCVGVTVLAVCTWASAVGALIPLGAERVGIDPTLVSAPAISTLVDASGLIIYFTTAHLLVAQLR